MTLQHFANRMRSTYEPGHDDPWWYDNALHFASGVVIGLPLVVFGGAAVGYLGFLLAAFVWEAFEYAYNIRPWDEREDWTKDRAIEDTILDTVMGLAGVFMVVLLL